MRLTLLFLVVAVIALATFMILASLGAGRVDVLALAGFQPDEHLTEVEYCEHWEVLNFILGSEGAKSGKMTFATFLLRGPEDEATTGRIERALRRTRLSRPWPSLLTPYVLRLRGTKGTVRYLTVWPKGEDGTAWIEMAKYNSPALLRLLETLREDTGRLRDRTWPVPPRSQVADLSLRNGM